MREFHIGFVVEQALGHATHAKNLQANVPKDASVQAYWGLLPWEVTGWAARLPLYKSNWTVRSGWRARQAIRTMTRQAHLDALFIHTQVPAVLVTDWVRRLPSVVSLDATPQQYDSLGAFYGHDTGPAWMEGVKWRLNRACFDAARHLVAWTEWTKQGLVDEYGVPAEKVTVIPPGVNTREWMRPTPRPPAGGAVKILFVGGNLERKGGLLLLEAFRALRDRYPLELHLATRDKLVPEPGIFVYNNMQPNSAPLKQLYHDSDIFCLPTYGDCLPMVLSEAGAAGIPCVATRVAGIPEIVLDGETGFLMPTGDVPALTESLRRLIEGPDLRARMGERAVAVVSERFDAERNAMRLLELLKGVA